MQQTETPLITVITVVYNDEPGVRKTLESVATQTYERLCHVVIDGGSNDGTVQAIEAFAPGLRYWHSRPDKGLYDAMNLGIQAADEGFCYFLNAGDVFDGPETIALCAAGMQDPEALYVGICVIHSRFGQWLNPGSPRHVARILNRQDYPHHQSSFYPTSFLKNVGFDTRYRFIADIVLNRRAIKELKIDYLPVRIAHSELGGFSTGAQSWKQIRRYVRDEMLFVTETTGLTLVKRLKIESKYFLKYVLSNIGQGSGLHWLMDVKHRLVNG